MVKTARIYVSRDFAMLIRDERRRCGQPFGDITQRLVMNHKQGIDLFAPIDDGKWRKKKNGFRFDRKTWDTPI